MKAREEKVNKNQTDEKKEKKKSNNNNNVNESTWHNANESNEKERKRSTHTLKYKNIGDLTIILSDIRWVFFSSLLLHFISFHFIVCLHLRFSDAFFTALSLPLLFSFASIILVCVWTRNSAHESEKPKPNSMILDLIERSVCMR